VPGLLFHCEVMDVHRLLGGYNFQWAWGKCLGVCGRRLQKNNNLEQLLHQLIPRFPLSFRLSGNQFQIPDAFAGAILFSGQSTPHDITQHHYFAYPLPVVIHSLWMFCVF